MHVPLAFTLGLFTGMMIFVPYVGAWAAAVPAALMGLLQKPRQDGAGSLLYLAVHLTEGYAVTPCVQRRDVRLPPVLTILAQALMSRVAGVLGVIVATPGRRCLSFNKAPLGT